MSGWLVWWGQCTNTCHSTRSALPPGESKLMFYRWSVLWQWQGLPALVWHTTPAPTACMPQNLLLLQHSSPSVLWSEQRTFEAPSSKTTKRNVTEVGAMSCHRLDCPRLAQQINEALQTTCNHGANKAGSAFLKLAPRLASNGYYGKVCHDQRLRGVGEGEIPTLNYIDLAVMLH